MGKKCKLILFESIQHIATLFFTELLHGLESYLD
jgi:hypothetical protein